MKLPQVPYDKAQHFIYGTAIAAATLLVFIPIAAALGLNSIGAAAIALITTALAGVLKEELDREANRAARAAGLEDVATVERADIAWTIAGAAVVCAPLTLGALL